MPTDKPIIQAVIDDNYYQKFKYLQAKTGRTKSNLGKYMIMQYIDQYEAEHGEIKVEE